MTQKNLKIFVMHPETVKLGTPEKILFYHFYEVKRFLILIFLKMTIFKKILLFLIIKLKSYEIVSIGREDAIILKKKFLKILFSFK